MTERKTLAILVGGGPAPGINSVIGAATIRARLEAVDVLGIRDGFEWIMQGDIDHVTPLDIGEVSRIHFRGGSYIGISRANPTKDPKHLDNAVLALLRLNVSQLITIGGGRTGYSATNNKSGIIRRHNKCTAHSRYPRLEPYQIATYHFE